MAAFTFDAQSLMAKLFPPTRWAVPGVIPFGASFLASPPKAGKSFLSLGLGISVASGTPAMGQIPTKEGDVLYISLEDGPARLHRRLDSLLGGHPTPSRLHFATEWPRLNDGGLERLETWLTDHPDARLVILDTWAYLKDEKAKDNYDGTYAAVQPLKRLAERHHVAVMIVHHTRKASQREDVDPLDSIIGSRALSGAADALLILRRKRGGEDATLYVTGRDVEDNEMEMRFNGGDWVMVGNANQFEPVVVPPAPTPAPTAPTPRITKAQVTRLALGGAFLLHLARTARGR